MKHKQGGNSASSTKGRGRGRGTATAKLNKPKVAKDMGKNKVKACGMGGAAGRAWKIVKREGSQPGQGLAAGSWVAMTNLQTRHDLNGKFGRLVELDAEKGRWTVKLQDGKVGEM